MGDTRIAGASRSYDRNNQIANVDVQRGDKPNTTAPGGQTLAKDSVSGKAQDTFEHASVQGNLPGGFHGNASEDLGASVNGQASGSITTQGAQGSASAQARAGLDASAHADRDLGPLGTAQANASGFVGARAEASAEGGIDRHGVQGQVNAGAFVGAEANANASVGGKDGNVGANVGVRAGYGADFSASGSFRTDSVGFKIHGGIAAGLGISGGVSVNVNPEAIAKDTVHAVGSLASGAAHLLGF